MRTAELMITFQANQTRHDSFQRNPNYSSFIARERGQMTKAFQENTYETANTRHWLRQV